MKDPKKIKNLSIVINLFFPPFGFYLLNDRFVFWRTIPIALLYGVIFTSISYLSIQIFSGMITIILFASFQILWHIFFIKLSIYSFKKDLWFQPNQIFKNQIIFPLFVIMFILLRFIVWKSLEIRIARPMVVSSDNMSPNINKNDIIMVSEFFNETKLERGDIVLHQGQYDEMEYIDRIIGLPSEHIKISNFFRNISSSTVTIYNQTFQREQIYSNALLSEKLKNNLLFNEKIGNKEVLVLESDFDPYFYLEDITIGIYQYFLLGDFRVLENIKNNLVVIDDTKIRAKFLFTLASFHFSNENGFLCDSREDFFCSYKLYSNILLNHNLRWMFIGYESDTKILVEDFILQWQVSEKKEKEEKPIQISKESAERFCVSAKAGLRLRKEPSLVSETIDLIPFQTEVVVKIQKTEEVVIDRATGNWVQVSFNDHVGWVFNAYLDWDCHEHSNVERSKIDEYDIIGVWRTFKDGDFYIQFNFDNSFNARLFGGCDGDGCVVSGDEGTWKIKNNYIILKGHGSDSSLRTYIYWISKGILSTDEEHHGLKENYGQDTVYGFQKER